MKKALSLILVLILAFLVGCATKPVQKPQENTVTLSDVPEFSSSPYIALNGNIPNFSKKELSSAPFENYSPLDALGRCGVAVACISRELMPTEERGSIGQVKPSGWHTVKYDIVDGKYLYNRCHLIGFQLTGENANECNLITGTRYMNVEGMLPFENMIADYIKETNNRVLYRVTPIYDGSNLVASGVQLEAMSVEDKGEGICFNVYVYNNQPGITIDYTTGESKLSGENNVTSNQVKDTFILNTSSKKIHKPDCSGLASTKESNKKQYIGTIDELKTQGYSTCGRCFE